MSNSVTPLTLQAELDQPLADLHLDVPGGSVRVVCRSSHHSLELRGYRSAPVEGKPDREVWVGANVSVYLPEFKGWDENEIQPASINHSSSSSRDSEGDVEVTVALLQLAMEVRDQLNEEAPVALAPAKAAWLEAKARYEAEALKVRALRDRQKAQIQEALGYYYDLRITVRGRKSPITGQAELENNGVVIDGRGYNLAYIEKVERRVNDSKFGQFVPVEFPTEA